MRAGDLFYSFIWKPVIQKLKDGTVKEKQNNKNNKYSN